MSVRDGLLVTRDFNSSPGESWAVDVPTGYTIASIAIMNVTLSESAYVQIRLSSGGSVVNTDVRVFEGSSGGSHVQDISDGGLRGTATGTSGLYGNLMMWNFNTLAPVTTFFENLSGGRVHRSAQWKSAASFNQIFIDASVANATLDSGIIYVQLYKRPNIVITNDFLANPLANWDIGGLTANTASAILLSSFNLALDGNAAISARYSTDGGSTFDSGADYRVGWVRASNDGAVVADAAVVQQTVVSVNAFCALFMGLPLNCRTLNWAYDAQLIGSEALLSMGTRDDPQVEDALRIFCTISRVINAGTGYAVKYRF